MAGERVGMVWKEEKERSGEEVVAEESEVQEGLTTKTDRLQP